MRTKQTKPRRGQCSLSLASSPYPLQQNLSLLVDRRSRKVRERGLSVRIEARERNLHSNQHLPLGLFLLDHVLGHACRSTGKWWWRRMSDQLPPSCAWQTGRTAFYASGGAFPTSGSAGRARISVAVLARGTPAWRSRRRLPSGWGDRWETSRRQVVEHDCAAPVDGIGRLDCHILNIYRSREGKIVKNGEITKRKEKKRKEKTDVPLIVWVIMLSSCFRSSLPPYWFAGGDGTKGDEGERTSVSPRELLAESTWLWLARRLRFFLVSSSSSSPSLAARRPSCSSERVFDCSAWLRDVDGNLQRFWLPLRAPKEGVASTTPQAGESGKECG